MEERPIQEENLGKIIFDLDELFPNINPEFFLKGEQQEVTIDEKFILEQLYK